MGFNEFKAILEAAEGKGSLKTETSLFYIQFLFLKAF